MESGHVQDIYVIVYFSSSDVRMNYGTNKLVVFVF